MPSIGAQAANSLKRSAEPRRSTLHDLSPGVRRNRTNPNGPRFDLNRTLVPGGVGTRNSFCLPADRPGLAEAYAVTVLERIRVTSSDVGSVLPPLLHGATIAHGSGSTIRRHTSGSSAVAEPWCGTLKTEARPCGRVRSLMIAVQPLFSRSAPKSTVAPAHSTHKATDNSLGDGGFTRRGDISFDEIRLAMERRNRSNVSSPGERDQTAQPRLRNTR